jgi:hypothetical protein
MFFVQVKAAGIPFKVSGNLRRLRQLYKPNVSFSFGGFVFYSIKKIKE